MVKCAARRVWVANLMACFALVGCSGSDEGSGSNAVTTGGTGGAAASGAGGSGGTQVATGGAGGGAGSAGMVSTPTGGSGGGGAGSGGSAGTVSSGGAGGTMSGGGMGGGGGGVGGMMVPPSGPVDGDPAKPKIEIDGVPCGAPTVGFGGSPPTVTIGGREVVVAYPCMNEGGQATFFLFIHGTLQDAQKVPFTMAAFPIHEFVDSHNVIVIVPKAIGTQWGRMDDGQDLPHLYEVIDWVYSTFGEKVDIRSMWASGGSWGAFYLSTFACDPMLENRLKGVRMVVGGGCPSCSGRLACIVAQQELELGGGMTLDDAEKEMAVQRANIEGYATMHGCDARTGPESLGPIRAWTWANCDPGFAHSYYLGAGAHADRWDDPTAMMHMVEEIKSIE
jgi:hypothetical protein